MPRYNEKVNGYWMCDVGRDIYKFLNKDSRLLFAREQSFFSHFSNSSKKEKNQEQKQEQEKNQEQKQKQEESLSQKSWRELAAGKAVKELKVFIERFLQKEKPESMALVLTPQFTQEELESLTDTFLSHFKCKNIFYWQNTPRDFKKFSDFDGLLYRGDANPNTYGLQLLMKEKKIQTTWSQLEQNLEAGSIKLLLVAAPENQMAYADLSEKIKLFQKASRLVWFSSVRTPILDGVSQSCLQVPLKSYIEKAGTFMNYKGLKQKIHKIVSIVSQSLSLQECAQLLRGEELLPKIGREPEAQGQQWSHWAAYGKGRKDQVVLEKRKKNEMFFERDKPNADEL